MNSRESVCARSAQSGLRDGVALFVLSLLARIALAIGTGFDGLYGQDPFAYYNYSRSLHAALSAFQLPPPFFWPIGYPLLAAAAMFPLGVRPLAAQAVSMVAGASIAPLSYALVREVKPGARAGALVAGLLAAGAAQLMLSSLSVSSDASGLAWITFSAWAMTRTAHRLDLRPLSLAAFAMGAAVLTRWIYLVASVPWALAVVVAWRGGPRLPVGRLIVTCALAFVICATVVGSQFVSDLGRGELSHLGSPEVAAWNPTNALLRTVSNYEGVYRYKYPIGVFYALPGIHPAFVFPIFTPFLLLGLWRLGRANRSHATLIVGWAAAVYVLLAGRTWENPRYSLSLFPPLAVLVGLGVESARETKPVAGWRHVLAVACAIGVIGSFLWAVRDVRKFTSIKAEHLAVVRWTEAQLPREARLFTMGLTLTAEHYTSLRAVDLYLETPESLSRAVCDPEPGYLLLDVSNIESQWTGKSPQINFQWLRNETELTELGQSGRYGLWRVGRRCGPDTARPE